MTSNIESNNQPVKYIRSIQVNHVAKVPPHAIWQWRRQNEVYSPLDRTYGDNRRCSKEEIGLQQELPSCKSSVGGFCLCSTIIMPAVWCIGPVANIWTKESCTLKINSAFSMATRHCSRVGMHPAVDLKWLFGLIPMQRSTVSFIGGLCFLHLVDPVQLTMWTTWSSH